MHLQIVAKPPMPDDPRDPPQVRIDTDAPYIHLDAGAMPSGRDAVSLIKARAHQQAERNAVIEADLAAAQEDLFHEQLLGSAEARRLSRAMPHASDVTKTEAAAISLRVFDPLWNTVGRYHAAEVICGALRNWLNEHHIGQLVPDRLVRKFSDKLARLAFTEWMNTLTGKRHTSARNWSAARLNVLEFGDTE